MRDDEEIKSQEELTQTKVAISIADVKGNDELNGKDIAELKEVITKAPEAEEKPYTMVGHRMPCSYLGISVHTIQVRSNLFLPFSFPPFKCVLLFRNVFTQIALRIIVLDQELICISDVCNYILTYIAYLHFIQSINQILV